MPLQAHLLGDGIIVNVLQCVVGRKKQTSTPATEKINMHPKACMETPQARARSRGVVVLSERSRTTEEPPVHA